MSATVKATFDGEGLRPDEPLELAPQTRVRVIIEPEEAPALRTTSFVRTAQSLQLEGPEDWSSNLDEYLYGKRPQADD
jgi:hypothetical protein